MKNQKKELFPYVEYPRNSEDSFSWADLDASEAEKDAKEFDVTYPYVIKNIKDRNGRKQRS